MVKEVQTNEICSTVEETDVSEHVKRVRSVMDSFMY